MKKMNKMDVNELRAYAVELGADEKKLYGTSKEALKVIINELKKENKEDKEMTKKNVTREEARAYIISHYTVKEMREHLKDAGITGISKVKKDELIEMMLDLEEQNDKARTQATDTTETSEQEDKRDMLESMTVKQLRDLAKDNDIEGMSKAKKEELIAALMFYNYGQPDPDETEPETKATRVLMFAFTGMLIGDFEAEEDGEHILVYTESKGELMFDKKTGKEICEKRKARYANRVERV